MRERELWDPLQYQNITETDIRWRRKMRRRRQIKAEFDANYEVHVLISSIAGTLQNEILAINEDLRMMTLKTNQLFERR